MELLAKLVKSSSFQHNGTKGSERETAIRNFLEEHFPKSLETATGEVVDPHGNKSPQLDLMIFDKLRNMPLSPGENVILPAEALLASFEVKSRLNKEEVRKTMTAAAKLKGLKPFKRPLIAGSRGKRSKGDQCRYFHSIIAFDTDIAKDAWASREMKRIRETASELSLPVDIIDRVYIVGCGLLHPETGRAVQETQERPLGLLNLYMHVLNFVIRENQNRHSVPYDQYTGRLTSGWKSV